MHLERLISVMEAIATAGRSLSAHEIQESTGLPLPTCYRMLQLLKEQRLLEDKENNHRYVIGERLIRIAFLARTDADVCSLTSPTLKQATNDFGETVFLSRFRNKGVSIIHVETPSDPTLSYMHPGLGYRPMHACSCAKAIVAFSDDSFKNLIMKGPLKAYTDHTRTSPVEFENELEKIKTAGYAECVEEIEVGVSSVAAPVLFENSGAVFSVGAIGPIRKFTQAHRKKLGKKLIGLAEDLSSTISIMENQGA